MDLLEQKKGWNHKIESILSYKKRYIDKIIGIDKPFQKVALHIDTKTFAFVRMKLTRLAINKGLPTRHYSCVIM